MSKETKTIREWFEGLPDGYKELALSNLENFPIDSGCRGASSLTDALDSGFWWEDTPEGQDFWDAVHEFVSYVEGEKQSEKPEILKLHEKITGELNSKLAIALDALKHSYRHCHLGHDHMSSGEIGDTQQAALCELMGDDAFCKWVESFDADERDEFWNPENK